MSDYLVARLGEDIIDVIVGARGPSSDINLFRQQQTKFSESQQYLSIKKG